MAWFMQKIARAIGAEMPAEVSYSEFIKLCFKQMEGRDALGMRDITVDVTRSLMPPGGAGIFRRLFPVAKWSCELNAQITKVAFGWMVGPMRIETSRENDLGVEMASVVHIEKCRWLQESGCTGMCVNMCKGATQEVFTGDFGLPLTIEPNFEDKSCAFHFGRTPPALEDDVAVTYPCNAFCATGKADSLDPCHKLIEATEEAFRRAEDV
eukprot:CAMPEP_0170135648 /NCGR_PEP_ID=MMETSP0033_2-20121228/2574_1 /TAXON_ID=195969 /ORGANISM="Dolichomastix tenuilepis, Strain CCMP3274" /LENGTH=209 /DNA_ID=CAMNT_0010371251 /DNA_START=142 /DNA_END=768 /DNA_ORIENTATION=-